MKNQKVRGSSLRDREINRLVSHVIILCYGNESEQEAQNIVDSTTFDDDIKTEAMKQIKACWIENGTIH